MEMEITMVMATITMLNKRENLLDRELFIFILLLYIG